MVGARLFKHMAIASINPATGEKLKQFSAFDDAEIEKRLARADEAFRKYRRTSFTERSDLLENLAELLFQEKETLAEIITLEMGKLFRARAKATRHLPRRSRDQCRGDAAVVFFSLNCAIPSLKSRNARAAAGFTPKMVNGFWRRK
jgi:hypothetical protein